MWVEPLPEIVGVELAAWHDLAALAFHETGPFEPIGEDLVLTALPADDLQEGVRELFPALQAKEVVTQVIAERAGVLSRLGEQSLGREFLQGIQGLACQIWVPAEQCGQAVHVRGGER